MRTYAKADFEAARTAWHDYGPEWAEIRAVMAQNGQLYPPSGSKWDERDQPEPTQRVIIWRALDYRPESTLALARRSRSWSDLVRRILLEEAALHETVELRERDTEWERSSRPSHAEAAMSVASILRRISDSAPAVPTTSEGGTDDPG